MRWTCANCERDAGKLEQAFEYKGSIVCGECYHRLSASPTKTKPARAVQTPALPPARPSTVPPLWTKLALCSFLAAIAGAALANSSEGSPLATAGLGLAVAGGLLLAILLLVLPYEIAKARSHPNATVIGILCILGLFTGICWLIALIWSVLVAPAAPSVQHQEVRRQTAFPVR